MHLKSVTLKGFKSFPDRTRLEFDPGVSVVVGPNGSGKSNVTDAILWALGEQRPLAIRGQSMQDVIFGGGRGVQAKQSAEVELVLDNSDGTVDLPVSEISVVRRLDRNGDGGYRLNGARCRLSDVQEILSDTGLGKEAHSVISQGRGEGVVSSKPKDRRLLIEEAAGLGKHRKRCRRAQAKLDRTRANLEQALLVEQEARKQLGPLKRQAEAAELHARLERQTNEARWELARDGLRERGAQRVAAETESIAAKAERTTLQEQLDQVVAERRDAEEALAEQAQRRDRLASRARRVASSTERVGLRLERVNDRRQSLSDRIDRRQEQLDELRAAAAADRPDDAGRDRITALETELEALAAERQEVLERELAALEHARTAAEQQVERAREGAVAVQASGAAFEARAQGIRARRRELEQAAERARRDAAAVGAQLAAANQFLRSHGSSAQATRGKPGAVRIDARSLSDGLRVEDGCELAVAAALDGRLGAIVAADPSEARDLLGHGGRDGARVLLPTGSDGEPRTDDDDPVLRGATPLVDKLHGDETALRIARRLLRTVWLVEELPTQVPLTFVGTLVTRDGHVWRVGAGELQRSPQGGEDRVLAERNKRDRLIADVEHAARAEQEALAAAEAIRDELTAFEREREGHEQAARDARRVLADAEEALRTATRAVDRRRNAPDEGPLAVRRAQLVGELAAERRTAERLQRERVERDQRVAALEAALDADRAVVPHGDGLASLLADAHAALRARTDELERIVAEDRAGGDDIAGRLRACAQQEADLNQQLRKLGDRLTAAEVAAQRARDQEQEIVAELADLAERLGLEAAPADEPLAPEVAEELRARVARLQRRREQLGPVNPLAEQAYEEARTHVAELETQRTDLETALRELDGFIRDTDRQIRETFEQTFEACATNFAELAEHVFPGGRGRLRLVGGTELASAEGDGDDATGDGEGDDAPRDEDVGVEIEITPAGKQMKRLTLMSGGEKTMTAIAFLFAVFLARPSPFYVLDEVEAALDDLNIDRFLQLLRRYRDRAQFIVVTHQKRTMDAADALYGVSMGGDGVSKVVSRRLDQSDVKAEGGTPTPVSSSADGSRVD